MSSRNPRVPLERKKVWSLMGLTQVLWAHKNFIMQWEFFLTDLQRCVCIILHRIYKVTLNSYLIKYKVTYTYRICIYNFIRQAALKALGEIDRERLLTCTSILRGLSLKWITDDKWPIWLKPRLFLILFYLPSSLSDWVIVAIFNIRTHFVVDHAKRPVFSVSVRKPRKCSA